MEPATIAAIATPPGSGGIGILKISGPMSMGIGRAIFRKDGRPGTFHASHRLYLGHIVDPSSEKIIDEVLLAVMRAPHTYTREDVVEIQAHSGPMVLKRLLEIVLEHGARLAEPGEFTRQAFINGRIDLTQAEAVIDTINARTEQSLGSAAAHLSGRMKDQVSSIRDRLLQMRSETEAVIDFPDEMSDAGALETAGKTLRNAVISPLRDLVDRYESAHVLRDGVRLIIIGRPNVGKSSLMNRLIEKDRVIVTAIPGTTRDLVEETIDIRGIPVTIADSAGLHDSPDTVERLGMQMTRSHMERCDMVLMMIDAETGLTEEDREIYENARHKKPMMVINKIDCMGPAVDARLPGVWDGEVVVKISALYGTGIRGLKDAIARRLMGPGAMETEFDIIPNLRHKMALQKALDAAIDVLGNIDDFAMIEPVSMDLKKAIDALGEILGVHVSPDILDEIFSRFCIGK